MNKDTGRIYRTDAEIAAAQARGEPLVPIGPHAQNAHAGANRRERRAKAAAMRRRPPLPVRTFKVRQ